MALVIAATLLLRAMRPVSRLGIDGGTKKVKCPFAPGHHSRERWSPFCCCGGDGAVRGTPCAARRVRVVVGGRPISMRGKKVSAWPRSVGRRYRRFQTPCSYYATKNLGAFHSSAYLTLTYFPGRWSCRCTLSSSANRSQRRSSTSFHIGEVEV